jgi:flagellar basal-body rod protein FlgB
MPDLLSDHFQFHQKALALRAERQQILASNMANADTPHYKARDIDFRQSLAHALGASSDATLALAATHSGHRVGSLASGAIPLLYRLPRQDSIDGNTVELDTERALAADNALRYEAGLLAINSKIKDLLAVMQAQ